MELTDEIVRTRVRPLADALGADGYDLEVMTDGDGRVTLQIVATADACPDCLVPKAMMATMFAEAIAPGAAETVDVELRYPGE